MNTHNAIEVADYCDLVFASLARRDQRRWAETYVRGLLTTPGRKNLAAVCERMLGGRDVQPLQQFVNQSTWDHAAVRADLGELAAGALRPRAWALQEVAFLKNGSHSVGVARQFAHCVGRTLNCQLGLAGMLVTERAAVPVHWRLMLPPSWDADDERRAKAHVPEDARHQPRWRHLLALADEIRSSAPPPSAPLLIDGTCEPDVEPLLGGLDARGLGYIVQVAPSSPAAQLVRISGSVARRLTVTGKPRDAASPFVAVTLPGSPRPRLAIAECNRGSDSAEYWVTNLVARSAEPIVALARLRAHSRATLNGMSLDYGLGEFAGRSFRGWHHHVTLASVAATYATLAGASAETHLVADDRCRL